MMLGCWLVSVCVCFCVLLVECLLMSRILSGWWFCCRIELRFCLMYLFLLCMGMMMEMSGFNVWFFEGWCVFGF